MSAEALPDAEAALVALVERMGAIAKDAALVGIYSGGAWLAERLAKRLPGNHALGFIDVSYYRDDYALSAAQPQRRADASAHAGGSARRGDHPHPRHGGTVRFDRRARSQESPAASRQGGLQPVLRELDANPDDVRDRRQAIVGGRHQP